MIENGQVVEFSDDGMELAERVPGGYVFVDGAGVGDIGPTIVREREALSRDGFVLVNVTVDQHSYRMINEPEIITRGFVYGKNGEDLFESARKLVNDAIISGEGNVQSDLEQTIKSFLFNKTRRRPMVFVMLNKV